MNLLTRLSQIHELPTLPDVAVKIRQVVFSSDGDAALLAKLIERDPPLAAKVLKVANSSFYGGVAGSITSVQRAVTRIGFNEIGDIALAVSLIKKFSRTSSLLDYPAFWRHSLGAATLAGSLARRLKDDCSPDKHNEYFMAGLLHDIGILLYDQFFRDDFAKIISHAKNTGISFVNAEANLFPEESHAALGGALLGHWRLGEAVAAGVGHHHDFDSSTQDHHAPIRQLTGAAEWLLRRANDKTFEGPDDCALKFILGTEPKEPADLEELLTLANEASAQAEAFFL